MFSPITRSYTSKKPVIFQANNKVTHVKKTPLSLLLGPTKISAPASKLAKPSKVVKNSDGIRPDFVIHGDDSIPASVTPGMSRQPSFVLSNLGGDADETMMEMSIDEHTQSKP